MSDHKHRIDTINVLVASSVIGSNPSLFNEIKEEFSEVYRSKKIKNRPRKRLLQVLHSTRGMDSTLAGFISHHGYTVSAPALGSYLYALKAPPPSSGCGAISEQERVHYQNSIVNVRNRYMHKAGTFPANDPEIIALLSEMQNCLTRVFSL